MVGKKVSGAFLPWDVDLRTHFFVYEVKGELNKRCPEIWAQARDVAWRRYGHQTRKEWMKSIEGILAELFTPRSYKFKDQPKTLGRSLADLFYLDVHLYRKPPRYIHGLPLPPLESEYLTCTGHIFDDRPIAIRK